MLPTVAARSPGPRWRRTPYAAAVSLALILASCSNGSGKVAASTSSTRANTTSSTSSYGSSPSKVTKVTSNLDGESALPLRTRWIATVEPAGAVVNEVDFLIDGKVIWIEHDAPYVFGGDDSGTDLGYLITTWLSPGTHRFSVRAIGISGPPITDSLTATVAAPPRPPVALRGTWARTVTQQDINAVGAAQNGPPAGGWELVFDQVGAWELDPHGGGLGNQYSVAGNILNVYAPIQEAPCENSSCGIIRYGHTGLGGTDCDPSGPFG